jgi:hypothetical protein
MDARRMSAASGWPGWAADLPGALVIAGFMLLGAALGAGWLLSLRWNASLYLRRGPAWSIAAMPVLRIAAVEAALLAIARAGAVPLLAAAAGMLAARAWILRWSVG